MKSTKQRILAAVLTVQGVLLTGAMAHPGPPGHTHGDDWPFGPLSLMALAAITATTAAAVVWKRRQSREAR